MNQASLIPELEQTLWRVAREDENTRRRVSRRSVAIGAGAIVLAGSASAGAAALTGLWDVSGTAQGGVCVKTQSAGFCADTKEDVDAGRAFAVEYPPDRVVSVTPSRGTFKVVPSTQPGTAIGIAPQSAVKVVVLLDGGSEFDAAEVTAGRYTVSVPPQAVKAHLQLIDASGRILTDRPVL